MASSNLFWIQIVANRIRKLERHETKETNENKLTTREELYVITRVLMTNLRHPRSRHRYTIGRALWREVEQRW